MSRAFLIATSLVAVLTVFSPFASADYVNGVIHLSGDLTVGVDPSGNGTITFNDVAGQTETFTVDYGSGSFASLNGLGDEVDISSVTAPINTMVNIVDFLTFQNSPLTFTLTEVYGGIDGNAGCSNNPANAAPGNVCTPTGTPYNLQDLGKNNSTASFVVQGYLVSGGTNTPATITFSAASTGSSYEQLLADEGTPAGVPAITYGAQLQASSPEPSTALFSFSGGLLLAFGVYRRKRSQQALSR